MTDLFDGCKPVKSLKELLLEARARNKFSVEDVALKIGCEPRFYESLETGKLPGAKWVAKLSRTLTIPLEDIHDAIQKDRGFDL